MTDRLWIAPGPAFAGSRFGWVRRALALIGRTAHTHARFVLFLASLSVGVIHDAMRPAAWRRTVRSEFRRALRQAVGGGLSTALVTAALIGLIMVSQALYWLGEAGQRELIGPVLVIVLVREVTPLLVGVIVLGRSGVVVVSEIGELQIGGQVRTLAAQGLDPFPLLVLPRGFVRGVVAILLASVVLSLAV